MRTSARRPPEDPALALARRLQAEETASLKLARRLMKEDERASVKLADQLQAQEALNAASSDEVAYAVNLLLSKPNFSAAALLENRKFLRRTTGFSDSQIDEALRLTGAPVPAVKPERSSEKSGLLGKLWSSIPSLSNLVGGGAATAKPSPKRSAASKKPPSWLFDSLDSGVDQETFHGQLWRATKEQRLYHTTGTGGRPHDSVLTKLITHYDAPNDVARLIGSPSIYPVLRRELRCDMNHTRTDGYTPLYLAASMNRHWTVQVLLEYGARKTSNVPSLYGRSIQLNAVDIARSHGHTELASYIDDFASADSIGRAPADALFSAVQTDAKWVVEDMITTSKNRQLKFRSGPQGMTVLMRLVWFHDWPRQVFYLLRRGCDVNANAEGITALHLAARYNRPESARVLLERGADKSMLASADAGTTSYDVIPMETAAACARRAGWDELADFIEVFGLPAGAGSSIPVDVDELEDVPPPAEVTETQRQRHERWKQRGIKVKFEEIEEMAEVEETEQRAARRVKVKQEHQQSTGQTADCVATTELLNLTDEVPVRAFVPSSEQKPCPGCRQAVTVPADKVNCGWVTCMACATEFCWRCSAILVGRKRRCRCAQ